MGLVDNQDIWRDFFEEVESACCGYFGSQFSSPGLGAQDIERVTRLIKNWISDKEQITLDRLFTPLEIREALFQMHPNKSPSPYGLSPLFYQSKWELVRGTVPDLCLKVLNEDMDAFCINRTLITLIPKVDNLSCVSQFRSISLCNVIYKIFSKCLANRMKPIMNSVIAETQSVFVSEGKFSTTR